VRGAGYGRRLPFLALAISALWAGLFNAGARAAPAPRSKPLRAVQARAAGPRVFVGESIVQANRILSCSAKGDRRQRYSAVLRNLEQRDPQVKRALEACGGSSAQLSSDRLLTEHYQHARHALSTLYLAETVGLSEILEQHYQSKNKRWGFVGVGLRNRRGHAAARAKVDHLLETMQERKILPLATSDGLRRAAYARVDQLFAQTRWKRFPDHVPFSAGSTRFWTWLGRFGQVIARSHDKMELILDGPSWRTATLSMVAKAEDFLHIATWAWHHDKAGVFLARAVVARKLGLSVNEVERQLGSGKTVAELRDERLVAYFVQNRHWRKEGATAFVQGLSEARKRELVSQVLEPLEVRVLLGARVQGLDRLRARMGSVIPALEQAGVVVIKDNRLFQPEFPFVRPSHLWAAVPHAKIMISKKTALCGGMNIGEHYMQPEGEQLIWHDAALRVAGSVTHDLNSSFANHWNRAVEKRGLSGSPIITARRAKDGSLFYYPATEKIDPGVRSMLIGTDSLTHSMRTEYSHRTALMLALASARREFQLVVPFFNSPLLVKQLIRTAKRFKAEGKDPSKIRIVITGNTTQLFTGDLYTNHFVHLLQREGITVEAWKPDRPGQLYAEAAVHHAKAWLVDGRVAYLGSANANVRSLVQDWEVGILTDDPSLIGKVRTEIFDADRKYCKPIKIRPAWQRRVGHTINLLFGPVLRLL
jgi:phosphatidylserine/phosphatidylglycerophosphate/cardiolipin synthase-like enzyme